MKRVTACLMALSLLAMCILPVRAEEMNVPDVQNVGQGTGGTEQPESVSANTASQPGEMPGSVLGDTVPATKEDKESVSDNTVPAAEEAAEGTLPDTAVGESRKTVSSSMKSGIEVAFRNTLPIAGLTLQVVLEKDNAVVASESVSLGEDPARRSALFEAAAGSYHLKVTAPGFLAYEQDIVVQDDIREVEIHTGFVNLEGCEYRSGSLHPGVMMIGDATGDGRIDEEDKNAITAAMSGTGNGSYRTDLNGDGKTDLVDLQYYANSKARLRGNVDTVAPVTGKIAPGAVQVSVDESRVSAEGDLGSLLSGKNGSVKLKNKNAQTISPTAPVEIVFDLGSQAQNGVVVEQTAISMGQDTIESGWVSFETDQGPMWAKIVNGKAGEVAEGTPPQDGDTMGMRLLVENGEEQGGSLTINLGKQVAVKKVTLRITGTKNQGMLAEITRVEFLNDMEKRISEPDMNIPRNLTVTGAHKSFDAAWEQQVNVTAYEVEISHNGQTEVIRAASNKLEVKSFAKGKLVNGENYEVRVRSVNGTWRSPYSETKTVVPKATKKPDPPDNLKATGGYRSIRLSWKHMEDTETYNIYYKEAAASAFQKIPDIESNQYEITGLQDQTVYEVYVTGVNEIGESGPSLHSQAQTISLKPAQMPNYKLINESNGKGKVSAHITNVTHGRGTMESSALDQDGRSALGTVDKDFGSYYQILDWDDGAEYVSPDKGLLFTLDDYYKMSYITFAEPMDIASYSKVSVFYYDKEHPNGTYAENVSVLQRTDGNGRKYYLIKLAQPITANKIRLGFSRGYNLYNIVVAEVNFYYYDSLEDDILALYGDDLHTMLKEGVTEETINDLQRRLDTKDARSGEYHPEREVLQRELDNAKGLLSNTLRDVVEIDPGITAARDGHLGFGGLNAWQPLGVTAYEGEQLVVYVGHDRLGTGSDSALKLIATQYHAESGALASAVCTLKVGRNEITVPSIQSLACEGGGALYVQYTGNNADDRYAVRVSGGAKEPVLNLYGVTDAQSRKARIEAYVKELEEHVGSQEQLHEQVHETAGEGNKVNRKYDKQNCILGATDIVLDQMMLSVSAEQILGGLGNGTTQERADKLDKSLQAMEDMMRLFYHHKGLSDEAGAPETDRMPAQHLNIRYMRMFAGAFMYAAGNHVGIEWGSVPGLASASPVVADSNGRYISGNYFGWGIGHEIGHNINQGSYAIAEVTNNYFAQLARAKDSNDSVRFRYEDVYKKVTSNTVGHPSNVFMHLAMYWQLHLAYDRGYNYKTYGSYQEQHDNLFYARVDSYSRNTSLAPGGLVLGGDPDQNIMRLACAAAEKDLTEFFMRWGLVPDEGTASYAGQFSKEERALYYLTDDARVYEMEHGVVGSVKDSVVVGAGSSVTTDKNIPNEVIVSIQNMADEDVILGYEIARYYYEDGKPVRQVVGFTTETTYRDHVSLLNNRVLTYEVTAVDQFGYRSMAGRIGDVRISHDGSHDKSMWSVTANMTSDSEDKGSATEEDPCDPVGVSSVYRVIDNDYDNAYEGQAAGGDPELTIGLNQVLAVCGLKYTVRSGTPIGAYEIQVSVDGADWTTVKKGVFENKKGSQTVYFENGTDPWICTYDAAYVRLKAPGQSGMNIAEIDLLGPSGDDITFGVEEDSTRHAVGILQEAYSYEAEDGSRVIPEGSLIFVGSYKGNPAYNVVVLYDDEGNIVGGVDDDNVLTAEQIILANVPENGNLGEVSDGIWIYWIAPVDGKVPDLSGKTVRAQLYRVDNALTNEGQRLVSDTNALHIPEQLSHITLKKDMETGSGE